MIVAVAVIVANFVSLTLVVMHRLSAESPWHKSPQRSCPGIGRQNHHHLKNEGCLRHKCGLRRIESMIKYRTNQITSQIHKNRFLKTSQSLKQARHFPHKCHACCSCRTLRRHPLWLVSPRVKDGLCRKYRQGCTASTSWYGAWTGKKGSRKRQQEKQV